MNVISNDYTKLPQALAPLYLVDDPEIGLNVVDLGLIYEINFEESTHTVNCVMTLTTQFCPMGETITNGVNNALQSVFDSSQINVELTFDPPWSQQMISEQGREFLGA